MATQDILIATVTDVRPLASMLRALSFRTKAVVDIRAHGIKLTVEEGRSIQANAYLSSTSFTTYEFNFPLATPASPGPDTPADEPSEATFGISLSTLLECLNIFGNATQAGGADRGKEDRFRKGKRDDGEKVQLEGASGKVTSLRMSYAGEGEPLVLLLEESGIVTRCEITTYEPDELMDLPFDDELKVQKLIMKSEWLRDALAEIDSTSEKLIITFSPAEHAPTPYNRYANSRKRGDDDEGGGGTPTFRLESVGVLGSAEMDYPNDRDVLEMFECEHLIVNTYKFKHIQLTNRALIASSKTSIRTADDGLISFQFMIPLSRTKTGESKDGFVEFLCVPLDADY